jgi:hypothetical protein
VQRWPGAVTWSLTSLPAPAEGGQPEPPITREAVGKRAAGEPTKFNRSGIELLGVASAARLECRKPAAEAGELIRRQLGDGFGDFFHFHAGQYSTAGGLVEPWKRIWGTD